MIRYYPNLRAKTGELSACRKLAADIKNYMTPIFTLVPPEDKEPEKGPPLDPDELAYTFGKLISKCWPHKPAFIDPRFVALLLGPAGLKKLFRIAQGNNSRIAALVQLDDLANPACREFLEGSRPRLGILIRYQEMDVDKLLEGIKAIGCAPEDCVLFVNFDGMPFELEGSELAVAEKLNQLGGAALWGGIVFQGSAFPIKEKTKSGGQMIVRRHESEVFHKALKELSIDPARIGFSDFGADHGRFKFSNKAGMPRPIRRLRYTINHSILIVRGEDTGSDKAAMRDVCSRILTSGQFAGQQFSYADRRIWEVAQGILGPGTPTIWREWNMAHHMTHVIRHLGALAGIDFLDDPITTLEEQLLFPL